MQSNPPFPASPVRWSFLLCKITCVACSDLPLTLTGWALSWREKTLPFSYMLQRKPPFFPIPPTRPRQFRSPFFHLDATRPLFSEWYQLQRWCLLTFSANFCHRFLFAAITFPTHSSAPARPWARQHCADVFSSVIAVGHAERTHQD